MHTRVNTASDRSTSYPTKSDTGFPDNNVATGGPPLNVTSDSQKSNQENGSITKVELVTDQSIFELVVGNEGCDVWQIYLAQQKN